MWLVIASAYPLFLSLYPATLYGPQWIKIPNFPFAHHSAGLAFFKDSQVGSNFVVFSICSSFVASVLFSTFLLHEKNVLNANTVITIS
jgi:hypothetical protein